VLAVVLLGPVLGPGALLNLDLVLLDPVPVPRGVWALGPELPRRVPLWLPVAWLAPLISSELVGKALMAASIAVAFVGAYRLTRTVLAADADADADAEAAADGRRLPQADALLAAGAGVLYGAGPFLLTRLAAGHLMLAVATAVLPWALPHLLAPDRSRARTLLAALALGLTGAAGGVLAVIVVGVGLAVRRGRDLPAVAAAVVLAQLPWLVPGLVVASGAGPTDAAPFATEMDGLGGVLGLVVGHGFWQPYYQVGRQAPVAVLGAVVAVLALVGAVDLPRPSRVPAAALATIGLVGAAASAVPGARDGFAVLTRLPAAGVVRESQRLLVLALVVIAPCAALGARRVGRLAGNRRSAGAGAWRGAASASVLALALLVAGPALWGIDPRLAPVEPPPGWSDAQAVVGAAPGTVLALPWHQYFDLRLDGTVRRVLNPAPLLLGGDVLTSSDPELGQPDRRERLDPREPTADAIVAAARAGEAVSGRLGTLGVRWVLVLHAVDWAEARGIGESDPGLRPVVRGPALDLWEVRSWPGPTAPALDPGEEPSTSVIEPVLVAPPSATAVNRPYERGWLRGLSPAGEGPGGILSLPEASGPVWYWPAVLALLGDGVCAAATIAAVRAVRGEVSRYVGTADDAASTSAAASRAKGGGGSLPDPSPSIY
jgi:hypothetical protein